MTNTCEKECYKMINYESKETTPKKELHPKCTRFMWWLVAALMILAVGKSQQKGFS